MNDELLQEVRDEIKRLGGLPLNHDMLFQKVFARPWTSQNTIMKKVIFCFLFVYFLFVFEFSALAQENETPLELGSKRELFVDDYLVAEMQNLSLRLHEPICRDIAVKFDQPWEGAFCGYGTVLKDGDDYRFYYRGHPVANRDGSTTESLCVAFSKDGIRWDKPKLNLCEYQGSKENNILMTNVPNIVHNFSPMIDSRPGVPKEERYKGLGGTIEGGGLFAFSSADGLVWKKMSDKPILTKGDDFPYAFDSQNVPLWSENEQCYVCYFRVVKPPFKRWIARATSQNFLEWKTEGAMEIVHNGKATDFEQYYTNQTGVYFRAPHLYVATPARFMAGRQVLTEDQAKEANVNPNYFKDCSDAVLLTSRGGNRYDRTFMEALIRPGIGIRNWVSRTNYPACNIVPTGENEMSMYVVCNYATPEIELRRYSFRLDGFASLHASYKGGTFVSKPLIFDGKKLSLNFSTSAAGGMKVQLEQPDGTPFPDFTLDDCKEIIGNEIARNVLWKNGSDVSPLAGKPVRLRIVMKDADLYSLRFE